MMNITAIGANQAPPSVHLVGPELGEKVGMICPHDMVLDHELWRWMPDGVELLFTRTSHHDQAVGLGMAEEISDHQDVMDSVRRVMAAGPVAVGYACASGSFVHGVAGARELAAAMQAAGAPIAMTTSEGLLMAMEALGTDSIAVATPYFAELTDRLVVFLEQAGKKVVRAQGLGLDRNIWTVPYAVSCDLIAQADDPQAEAIFVSCTNLPTYDLIAPMEQALGKPIITANQVTAWGILRELGRQAIGPGQRLLQA